MPYHLTADDRSFLAAIAAQEDDHTPRLVYADWLDENRQPERAELIRVQCELARFGHPTATNGVNAQRHEQLRKRNKALSQWFRDRVCECGFGRYEFAFARGFLTSVTCTWERWLEAGTCLLAHHWCPEIILSTKPDIRYQEETQLAWIANLGVPEHRCRSDRREDIVNTVLGAEWPSVKRWVVLRNI